MGFECRYEIETSRSVEQIYQTLKRSLPFVTRWRDFDGRFRRALFTENEGLQISVYETIGPDVTQKYLGFRPTVTVSFDLARGDHPAIDEGMDNMRRGVDWLINNIEGDAVFLANGDRPVLLRRNDQVWLDTKSGFWRERDIPLLTFPYKWNELPKL